MKCADMTVALVYFKCLDDWQDERKFSRKVYASWLKKPYEKVKSLWPEKCQVIEAELRVLSQIENAKDPSPDAAANCFGRLMGELFVLQEDHWQERLYQAHAPFEKDLDLDWVRRNSIIIHYCGRNKPWKKNYLGQLDVFYRETVGRMNDRDNKAGRMDLALHSGIVHPGL